VVISPRVVLTAAHCLELLLVGPGATFSIFLGADLAQAGSAPALVRAVSETRIDPLFDPDDHTNGHDIGVVIAAAPLGVSPVPLNRGALAPSLIGAPIRLVGYGIASADDEQGVTAGVRRDTVTRLADFDDLFLAVDDPAHAPCSGDSGGPALLPIDGVETIVGIASIASATCAQALETRVDPHAAEFIDPIVAAVDSPQTAPGATAGGGCAMAGRPAARPTALLALAALVVLSTCCRARRRH